ncbi:MAG: methyltransferase domain-containing protein, partial [bacterium]|nr:methyltransferase domain-containing protein [bacterium]
MDEFEGPRYQRIGHIRKLISDGVINEDLKHSAHVVRARAAEPGNSEHAPGFVAACSAASCVACGHGRLLPVLDMGMMPRSDGLIDGAVLHQREQKRSLRVAYCPGCTLVQLLETPSPREMFGDDYLYFSSFSDDLLKHSRENAFELIEKHTLGPSSLVVEIASNDGYMLKNFKDRGIRVLGIDPAPQQAQAAREKGIDTITDFFGSGLAKKLTSEGRKANLIIANNVVAHVANQNDLIAGFAELLADDGLLVVEFPYVRDLIDYVEFDTIYHEHRCYFSVTSATALFRGHGLYLNDVR